MNGLKVVQRIGKGYSSEIFLVEFQGKKFVIKKERAKSPRVEMVKKEVENLLLANSAGIGPKLFAFDFENKAILMEHVEAITFNEWLFRHNPEKKQLKKFIQRLFFQAKKLDKIGLDHGQLAGRGKNILVRKKDFMPVIIDFEKASAKRKCHNVSQLESLFYWSKHSAITKRVAEILSGKEQVLASSLKE